MYVIILYIYVYVYIYIRLLGRVDLEKHKVVMAG